MKNLLVALVAVFVMLIAFPAFSAVHVIQRGETLLGIARLTGHTVNQLMLMNNLKNPDFIMAGRKIVYISTADRLKAKLWCERRRRELPPTNRNFEFFGWVIEDLQTNHLRYSIDEPSGTYYGLVLDFAGAEERIKKFLGK